MGLMKMHNRIHCTLLASLLAGSIFFSNYSAAQGSEPETGKPSEMPPTPSVSVAPTRPPTESASAWHARQGSFYKRNWGVDIVGVKSVSSGSMLRFSYLVLNADKAKAFNDKKVIPYLVDEATGAKFFIPEMEKVGKLRQTAPPVNGRIYWMIFANAGKLLKTGDHVDVVIGKVRVDGLVVE